MMAEEIECLRNQFIAGEISDTTLCVRLLQNGMQLPEVMKFIAMAGWVKDPVRKDPLGFKYAARTVHLSHLISLTKQENTHA